MTHGDGRHLPYADQAFHGVIAERFRDSKPDWPAAVRPPKEAPNIVVIVMDDLGFGHLSCYGGPIEAPNIAALAKGGLRYNNFHTAALCSPTRAALLTGRNHHSVGFASIPEAAAGFPGHNSFLPKSAATIAEILKLNGYSTFCAGKWHLTPTAEATAAGPFDHWPLGMGFERFHGFLPGESDHWHPILTVDNHRVERPERENYHFSEDIMDAGIRMIRDQQQVASGRPFFLYLPFGAPHCPFHAPKEYLDKYRGRFDAGWDQVREETFKRQLDIGIVPPGTVLPERNPGVAPWDSLDADSKAVYARLMEAFAAMMEHADTQIGRLIATLKELKIFEDTLIVFFSDNGASQEGGVHGTTNTERFRNLMPMQVKEMLADLERIGLPGTDPHYPTGWAMAGNTPFKRYKRDTHRGGNTDPLIIHWPAQVRDGGAIRSHYIHVTDIYPTLLELIGLPVPESVNGIRQKQVEGISFAATLFDAAAPQHKTIQYYEMLGSRALWKEGWTAVTWHQAPTDWDQDVWELYNLQEDYAQARDLSREHPGKLKELIESWWEEAKEHNVLPLDDRGRERFYDPTRPVASRIQTEYTYYSDTSPIPNPSMPVFVNCPHQITANLRLRSENDSGLIVQQGGWLGGWAIFLQDGHAVYLNNFLRLAITTMQTPDPLPVGQDLRLVFEWVPTAVGRGNASFLLNGKVLVKREDVPTSPAGVSHAQDGWQVGKAWGPSVSPQHYDGVFAFTGELQSVVLKSDRERQLRLSPQELLRLQRRGI